MILINVKFQVRPEYVDTFLDEMQWYTDACRAEEGNLFFDWFKNPEKENEFLLVEGFKDGTDAAHVESDAFKKACEETPKCLIETPDIINVHIDGKTDWDKMAEFRVE
ncbi:putative quinol monooxygenase [Corynebacterium silvaticum]|uniref:Quinol monooxygenase n=1 Tax=Corynebacterium silvaticum TaxID=2320431 RepID=A0A7Y4LH13_9CORY|nr:putative quinol monooxygenase [Corynebacterium silvaticum]ARU45833.1 putative quinol monooxygenase [Corynebacterium silvaticum]MBH5300385.1 antibiotic biosynthesis monooxygenase [Corynebacterium silvaticum]NOM64582.1 antibiotic biosynthesis monooxygenase [Corynebacterium silvaticum]NON69934.1 antibiotic biosynthesis monooxygenase [Corynebacterium silvaticum]TFA93229.1 antibiotic biosynthesis monooxygenase [Corynebacterium silvaticum]